MAALQPPAAFPAEFFDLAEQAVELYLGDELHGGDGADWPAARACALAALELRPRDGPLRHLLTVMEKMGVPRVPSNGEAWDVVAPPDWPGFRVLSNK